MFKRLPLLFILVLGCASKPPANESRLEKSLRQCSDDTQIDYARFYCWQLAKGYENGEAWVREVADLELAYEYYSKTCDLDWIPACERKVELHKKLQKGGFSDELERQCNKSSTICYYTGQFYKNGSGVPKNEDAAKRHFKRGCDGGDGDACDRYADRFFMREGTDYRVLEPYYDHACREGNDYSCLQKLYSRTQIPEFQAEALKELAMKCERDDNEACFVANLATDDRKFLEVACNRGSRRSCSRLGTGHVEGHIEWKQKACDLGDRSACYYVATHIMWQDTTRAEKMLRELCDDDYPGACLRLGNALKLNGIDVKSWRETELQKSVVFCKNGVRRSCEFVYSLVDPTSPSMPSELEHALKVIGQKTPGRDHHLMAHIFAHGQFGTEASIERSLEYHMKACDAGYLPGCNAYAWEMCHDLERCNDEVLAIAKKAASKESRNAIDTTAWIQCRLGDTKESNANFQKACEKGLSVSCKRTCVGSLIDEDGAL